MTTTKITQLTGSNVVALEAIRQLGLLTDGTVITATTATFPNNAYTASCLVRNAKTYLIQKLGYPANAHPVKSLSAVIRKLQKNIGENNTGENFDEPEQFEADTTAILVVKPEQTGPRTFAEIGDDIARSWKNPYFGAVPYIRALQGIHSTNADTLYGLEDAKFIALYFLSNSNNWRGDDARRIKAELKKLVQR